MLVYHRICVVEQLTLANGAITGAVFCSIVKNFPMERGAVVGIAKAWVGLCGGILTQLYVGFVGKPDNSKGTLNFVLMMAGAAMFAAVVPSLFVVVHKLRAVEEPCMWGRLGFCYVVVLGMVRLSPSLSHSSSVHQFLISAH